VAPALLLLALLGAAAPPLATPWPARGGCASYSGADVAVDDRVRAVEWRGPRGASILFEVTKATTYPTTEEYRIAMDGLECHRNQTSCLTYHPSGPRPLRVRVSRGASILPTDFAPGAFTELVLHDDVRGQARPRADRELDFGVRLVLHCIDSTKSSLAWLCDAKSCVPRTFRDNVRVQRDRRAEDAKPRQKRRYVPPFEGPYENRDDYDGDDHDLLICLPRLPGQAAANRAARKMSGNLSCAHETSRADAKATIVDVARDLLSELDLAAQEGCAGACSARVDELRAAARALMAAPELHVTSARAAFDRGDGEEDYGYGAWPSIGWVAKLSSSVGAAQVVCARHRDLDSMGVPEDHSCRLSVFAHGRHLGDYAPAFRPEVTLPDGGGVQLLDEVTGGPGEQVIVTGSALAQ
jgi:hypothetical protein